MRYQEPDYYAVLGVLPSVEQAALAAVYRALLKKYHPDVFEGSKAEAERITKELNEAYEVLGDPETRAQYDARRAASQGRSGDYESAAYTDSSGGVPVRPKEEPAFAWPCYCWTGTFTILRPSWPSRTPKTRESHPAYTQLVE
jgi:curved DNA-binding protein CbpA